MDPVSVQRIRAGQGVQGVQPGGRSGPDGTGFGEALKGFAKEVDAANNVAAKQVADLAAGNVDNVHKAMIELGKAEVTFGYMMEVRNKLIDAYKEVMRMQM
jgi:flagellar hook-basal body complex protein FliE